MFCYLADRGNRCGIEVGAVNTPVLKMLVLNTPVD